MQLLSVMYTCRNPSISPLSLTTIKGHVSKDKQALPAEIQKQQHKRSSIVKFPHAAKSLFISPLMAALVALSPLYHPPVSHGEELHKDTQRGAALFRKACIGCHYGGGNIIQPGATLFLKDLQRNGVETEEEIYKITYYGNGRMPGFGEKCTPRGQCTFGERLQDEEIKLLADFVMQEAIQGWPNQENSSSGD